MHRLDVVRDPVVVERRQDVRDAVHLVMVVLVQRLGFGRSGSEVRG